MTRFILIVAIIFNFYFNTGFAQCSLGVITLTSQAQVDDFTNTYGSCSTIEAEIIVNGPDINNLAGLNHITSLDGRFDIGFNPMLSNLDDLINLQTLDGRMWIEYNNSLVSLSGLSNVSISQIGAQSSVWGSGFIISNNEILNSLQGLQNFPTNQSMFISIHDNDNLTSLVGLVLPAISKISLDIDSNLQLNDISALSGVKELVRFKLHRSKVTDLDDLSSLEKIQTRFEIWNNSLLSNISGLMNLKTVETVSIDDNTVLASLSGLENIQSIIDLNIDDLPQITNLNGLDGIHTITGSFTLSDNPNLTSTMGFQPIHGFGDDVRVERNDNLMDLKFMTNIDSVNGTLRIRDNNSLPNLNDLLMLSFVDGSISIRDNMSLSDCSGICSFLDTGIHNGNTFISDNPSACSSVTEIQSTCPGQVSCTDQDIVTQTEENNISKTFIESTTSFTQNTDIYYQAEDYILLESDFEIPYNFMFTAEIGTCIN